MCGVICGLFIGVCRDIGQVSVHRRVEYGGEGDGMRDVSGMWVLRE